MTGAVWDGWWVVRWGQRMVHIEADNAEDVVQSFFKPLQGPGDWTEDPAALHGFPYVELGKHSVGHGTSPAQRLTGNAARQGSTGDSRPRALSDCLQGLRHNLARRRRAPRCRERPGPCRSA